MALYRFGMFEFDSATGELQKPGRRVRLRPQPARVLEHLLGRRGELVSRGELQRAIWPDGTFVHFDDGLNSCMKQIRAALGDRRSAPSYVETLVRRGFRFTAPVAVASPHERPGLGHTRIRVLPIRSLGDGEAGAASVAEGLGEEILAQLTGASPAEVAVVASDLVGFTATFEPETPIDFLLAVTVRMAGKRLRVTSKLIDARTMCHVWVGRLDVALQSLDAQVSTAERIVRQVIVTLGRDPGGNVGSGQVATFSPQSSTRRRDSAGHGLDPAEDDRALFRRTAIELDQ
jgi:DNA-binding winged helix-turn-helix (wHTH) protein